MRFPLTAAQLAGKFDAWTAELGKSAEGQKTSLRRLHLEAATDTYCDSLSASALLLLSHLKSYAFSQQDAEDIVASWLPAVKQYVAVVDGIATSAETCRQMQVPLHLMLSIADRQFACWAQRSYGKTGADSVSAYCYDLIAGKTLDPGGLTTLTSINIDFSCLYLQLLNLLFSLAAPE